MKKEVRQVDAQQMAHRRLRVDKKSIQPKPIQEEQKEDAGGVKTIPAVKREETRLRVCSYCRVSTLRETQTSSIDSQSKHYEDHIKSNSEWEYAGTYIETGVTGTKAEIRPELQRLLQDCRDHKIDLILMKSISRFARNTTDCLELVRYITSLGINIWFEKENINTMDARGEVLITIMSSLAQQESDSISKNVRMGIQYQMQQGKGRVNTSCFLGYTREGEELIIIPEQAEIVRRIYREYLEGYSPCMIAAGLTADNVPSPCGKPNWYQSTVVSILGNEKYCGDLLLQKYYVPDFLTHRVVRNEGQLPQYYVEDDHDPIIPKDVFSQVQGELQRRSVHSGKIRFGSGSSLKGRLICGKCGTVLKRYKKGKNVFWVCKDRSYETRGETRSIKDKCGCRHAPEFEIQAAIITVLNKLPGRRDEILKKHAALHDGELKRIDETISSIEERQRRMEEEYDESDENTGILAHEIESLEVERTCLILERAELANKEVMLRLLLELIDIMEGKSTQEDYLPACFDYDDFFRRTQYQPEEGIVVNGKIKKFDDGLVVRYLDKVIVNEDGYEVVLKGGITGDVKCLGK